MHSVFKPLSTVNMAELAMEVGATKSISMLTIQDSYMNHAINILQEIYKNLNVKILIFVRNAAVHLLLLKNQVGRGASPLTIGNIMSLIIIDLKVLLQ